MQILLALAVAVMPAVAQIPVAQLSNGTRPASGDFKIGDRFEIVITGAAFFHRSIVGKFRTSRTTAVSRLNTVSCE